MTLCDRSSRSVTGHATATEHVISVTEHATVTCHCQINTKTSIGPALLRDYRAVQYVGWPCCRCGQHDARWRDGGRTRLPRPPITPEHQPVHRVTPRSASGAPITGRAVTNHPPETVGSATGHFRIRRSPPARGPSAGRESPHPDPPAAESDGGFTYSRARDSSRDVASESESGGSDVRRYIQRLGVNTSAYWRTWAVWPAVPHWCLSPTHYYMLIQLRRLGRAMSCPVKRPGCLAV